ncbi:MAG: hydantoinase B/oxoprolinase family protein, partial [Gammaproteobacteria bacterium]|nr:hydantoinase B/oxoprolinase family protein [Gammaproteobacteria bacterium]
LRLREPTGRGVRGGGDGPTGGVWVWREGGAAAACGRGSDAASYRDATRVAGRLDPVTGVPAAHGEYHWFGRERSWPTPAGAVFRYVTNGGGGWGDPLARDPERVCRDVRDGYVSIEGARRDYGVVVLGDPDNDPEGLRVDPEATTRLRAAGTRAG